MAQIDKPNLHFNAKLYSGDSAPSGGGTQSVTGVGFQPDWIWLKCRSAGFHNRLFDAVRGAGKNLKSNNTDAEQTIDEGVTAFNSDGFSVKQGTSLEYNNNNHTYVSWNWKAGGSGSSNSDGTITSTVSANTTAGFSIATYTGNGQTASFGHGLSTPDIVMIKDRTDAGNEWYLHTTVIDGSEDYLRLNANNTKSDASSGYDIGASVFNLGGAGTWVNVNSKNYVAYSFKQVKGYSKFGVYKGNGNSDGTFVYTGFRPAIVIIKGAISGNGDAAQHWELYDSVRLGYNPDNNALYPSLSSAEGTSDRVDIQSNGFKIRINSDGVNDTNSTYFFMAFAKNPIVGSNNVPAVAR